MEELTAMFADETPVGGDDGFAALLAPEETVVEETVETVETVEAETGVNDPPQEEEQKDIGAAFAAERRRIEQREQQRVDSILREREPAYSIGNRILQDIMTTKGCTLDEAMRIAEDNFHRAYAAREGVSVNVARGLLRQPQPDQQFNVAAKAEQIRAEVAQMQMPDGFDFDTAVQDEAFAGMLLRMPVADAVELYSMQKRIHDAEERAKQASQDVAEKLKARQEIPQSVKPQKPVALKVDLAAMSDDEFFEYDSKLR